MSQITGRPPSLALNHVQKEAKMVLKVHHNHGQIRQPAAKQTFSLLRELKMAQIPGYNCALSALGWLSKHREMRRLSHWDLAVRAKFNHVQRCRIFTASFGIESTKSHQRVSAYDCIGVIPVLTLCRQLSRARTLREIGIPRS